LRESIAGRLVTIWPMCLPTIWASDVLLCGDMLLLNPFCGSHDW